MSRRYRVRLTTDEVEKLADTLLRADMAPFGFEGFDVVEERDFDGGDVLSVAIRVCDKIPSGILTDASDDLRQALRREGEDRWLYLKTKRTDDLDVDDEEDVD